MQATTRRLYLATKRHKVHKRGFYFCVLCDSWWLAAEFSNRPSVSLSTKLQVGKMFRLCPRAYKWNDLDDLGREVMIARPKGS